MRAGFFEPEVRGGWVRSQRSSFLSGCVKCSKIDSRVTIANMTVSECRNSAHETQDQIDIDILVCQVLVNETMRTDW